MFYDELGQHYIQEQQAQEIINLRASLAQLHHERDQLIALAVKLADRLDMPAGLTRDPECAIAEFEYVVAITLLSGQVNWHIPSVQLSTFCSLPHFPLELEYLSAQEQQQRMQSPFIPSESSSRFYTEETMHIPAIDVEQLFQSPFVPPAIDRYSTASMPAI